MLKRLALMGSLVIALAACGGAAATPKAEESDAPAASEAPAVGARTVDIEIGAGKITPASVDVKKGETITFAIKNVSTEEVELIVGTQADVDADAGDSLKEAENIAAGATASVTYTFDGAGPFAYGDQIADHYAKGAKGVIVVQP
jgi:plastocyanin